MDTPQVEIKPTAVVNHANKISKVIINRITRDLTSKVEMVIREASMESLLVCNLSRYRRRRGVSINLNISLVGGVRDTLERVYGEQIVTEDTTLKNLRFSAEQLEVQYRECLANYGMTYEPSYKDPFVEVKALFKDSILGKGIAARRMETLNDIIKSASAKMCLICIDVSKLIQDQADILNSSEPGLRKKTRERQLEEFANDKLTELINVRNQLKKEILDEYTKYTQERITKSHEDHGPVAIL